MNAKAALRLVLAASFGLSPLAAQTNVTWFGGSDVWSNSARWTPNTVPNGNFNVFINAGSATLDADYAIVGLTLNGTITGTQTLTTSGAVSFGGTVGTGATLQANGGVTMTGTSFLTAGTINNGSGQTFTQSVSGATLFIGSAGLFNNSGAFAAMNDAGLGNNGGSNTFNNLGTFTRSTGTGTYTVGIAFNNQAGAFWNVNSGTMSLTGGGSSAGTVSVGASGTLRLASDFNVSGGTLGGAGLLNLASGNTTIASSTSLSVASLSLAGTLTVPSGTLAYGGALTISGGTLGGAGTLQLNGTGTLGSASFLTGATLAIGATGSFAHSTTGSFFVGSNGLINNGGLYSASANSGIAANGGSLNAFNNAGTFTRDTSTGTFTVGIAFNNSGTVNANTGTLSLTGGGSHAGTFNVASGANLNFNNAHTFNSGSSFAGAGTLNFATGTQVVASNVSSSVGTITLASTLNLNGGTALTQSGALNLTGGTLQGGGTFNANGGGQLLAANSAFLTGATLSLGSGQTFTHAGNTIFVGSNGTLNNAGIYVAQSDGSLAANGGSTNAFHNTGAFNRTTGTGTFTVGINFNNSGTADVNSGTLALTGGGSSSGAFSVAGGSTLSFSSAASTLSAGASVSGAGTMNIAGPVNATGNVSLGAATTNLTNTLNIAASQQATVSGSFQWRGGTVNGAGTLLSTGGGSIPSGFSAFLDTARFNVGAGSTFTHDGSSLFLSNSAVIGNAGMFMVTGNGSVANNSGGGTINNLPGATFSRNTGTGTFTVGSGLAFSNQGTVQVQSGTLSINAAIAQVSGNALTGGTWTVANGATLNGSGFGAGLTSNAGTVQFTQAGSSFPAFNGLNNNSGTFSLGQGASFTTAAGLANSGTISLGVASALTVTGTFTQSAGLLLLATASSQFNSANPLNLTGGMLGGLGTINANVSGSGAGSSIAPGGLASIGTLTVNGTVAENSGSLLFRLSRAGAPASDLLTSTGNMGLTNSVFNVSLFGAAPLQLGDVFTLAHSNTVLTTTGSTFSFDPSLAGYTFDTSGSDAQNLRLTVTGVSAVPEPATWLAGALAVALGLRRLRQKRYSARSVVRPCRPRG